MYGSCVREGSGKQMAGSPEGCWLILEEDVPSSTCWGPIMTLSE